MTTTLVAPTLADAGGRAGAGSVRVALAFDHAHEWIQDAGMMGLFQCADPTCEKYAVCPGCVPHPTMALAASAAGFVVYWCVLHCEPHSRKGAAR